MLSLQRLLSKSFGAIPADITCLISNAPVEAIERWFDLAIDAQQLSDILGLYGVRMASVVVFFIIRPYYTG